MCYGCKWRCQGALVYDAFGKLTPASFANASHAALAVDFDRAFTGQVLDAETGLMLYRNRYYSTELGRFISRDPIGYRAGDMNVYPYVGNRPSSKTCPNGLPSQWNIDIFRIAPSLLPAQLPVGTPQKNNGKTDTINCQGGKLTLHIGHTPTEPASEYDCTVAHEEIHIADWIAFYGNDVCKGVADGYLPAGGAGYPDMLKKSECKAYKVGKQCRDEALGLCPEADAREALEKGAERDEREMKARGC